MGAVIDYYVIPLPAILLQTSQEVHDAHYELARWWFEICDYAMAKQTQETAAMLSASTRAQYRGIYGGVAVSKHCVTLGED